MINDNKICEFPGCNNKVAAITKHNFRFSKMYCEDHSHGKIVKCSVCNKEYKTRMSDLISILKDNKPIICRKCAVTKLNQTPAMRKQASELRKRTGKINIKKAQEKSYTKEAIEKRELTKRKNGYYDKNGGYYKVLETRKKNGSFQRMLDASHTSEVRTRANLTAWSKLSKKNAK